MSYKLEEKVSYELFCQAQKWKQILILILISKNIVEKHVQKLPC